MKIRLNENDRLHEGNSKRQPLATCKYIIDSLLITTN
jgi:hypothetical protein